MRGRKMLPVLKIMALVFHSFPEIKLKKFVLPLCRLNEDRLVELKRVVMNSRADCIACDDCVIRCESKSSDCRSLCVLS